MGGRAAAAGCDGRRADGPEGEQRLEDSERLALHLRHMALLGTPVGEAEAAAAVTGSTAERCNSSCDLCQLSRRSS